MASTVPWGVISTLPNQNKSKESKEKGVSSAYSTNVPNMPKLFESVRFLTTAVASEMSYAAGLQRQALFSIALVLFVFIMLINACLNLFLNKEAK